MRRGTEFTRSQWRIFAGCFLCYFSTYLTRLNLPAAMSSMMADLRLTGTQVGLLQTVFALVYAAGQLVNGSIVDHLSARRHILLGLGLSGVVNVLFGMSTQYWMLIALWTLNGAVQSMIWTPMIKLIAAWFKGRRRAVVSFGITLTLIAGNLGAWALCGFVASAVNWRASFVIPGAWAVLAAVATGLLLRDQPEPGEDLGEETPARAFVSVNRHMPLRTLLFATGMAQILVCCVGFGFVRDGIITWAPTIIANLNHSTQLDPTLVSLVIPLLNLIGVLLAQSVYAALGNNARRCTGYLMLLSAALAFMFVPAREKLFLCALLLGLCCASCNGASPMLTTFIPMDYERVGHVALVAGLMDAFIYVGSAMAGVVTGAISDSAGWPWVFVLWGASAVASGAMGLVSMRGIRRLEQWQAQPRVQADEGT